MTRAKASQKRLFTVLGCGTCPNKKVERTAGAGYAHDWICTAVTPNRLVCGYIEWPSEERKPGDFPSFCPLPIKGARKKRKT